MHERKPDREAADASVHARPRNSTYAMCIVSRHKLQLTGRGDSACQIRHRAAQNSLVRSRRDRSVLQGVKTFLVTVARVDYIGGEEGSVIQTTIFFSFFRFTCFSCFFHSVKWPNERNSFEVLTECMSRENTRILVLRQTLCNKRTSG